MVLFQDIMYHRLRHTHLEKKQDTATNHFDVYCSLDHDLAMICFFRAPLRRFPGTLDNRDPLGRMDSRAGGGFNIPTNVVRHVLGLVEIIQADDFRPDHQLCILKILVHLSLNVLKHAL